MTNIEFNEIVQELYNKADEESMHTAEIFDRLCLLLEEKFDNFGQQIETHMFWHDEASRARVAACVLETASMYNSIKNYAIIETIADMATIVVILAE